MRVLPELEIAKSPLLMGVLFLFNVVVILRSNSHWKENYINNTPHKSILEIAIMYIDRRLL